MNRRREERRYKDPKKTGVQSVWGQGPTLGHFLNSWWGVTGDEAEVDSRALQFIPHSVSRDPRSTGAAWGETSWRGC